jgi:hypothetical protein
MYNIQYAKNGSGYYWHVFTLGGGVLTVQNQTLESDLPVGSTGGFTLTNKMADAQNGLPLINLTGVSITFKNTVTGRVLSGMYTAATAEYKVVGLEVGDYEVEFVSDQTITTTYTWHIIGDSYNFSDHIINLSKKMDADTFRAVLTWATSPMDLDTHVYVNWNNAGEELVNYNNKQDAHAVANLDLDDTNGEGPETTTLLCNGFVGVIRYVVFNYSREKNLSQSSAIVKLYHEANLDNTYNVPSTGTEVYWHVFKIVNTSVSDVNVLSNYDNPI